MEFDDKILSIDADDNDKDYQELQEFFEKNTVRNKNKIADEFNEIGENLLIEIEEKNRIKNLEKLKLTKFILKKTKNKYSSRLLLSYSYEDVKNVYIEIKNRPNFVQNFLKFVFNL